MGLLDEAIREHLELKRKRGADPAELTRDEQEALGPAVRQSTEVGLAEPGEPGLAGADEVAASGAAPDGAPAPESAPETEPARSAAEDLEPAVPDPDAPPHHVQAPDEDLLPDPEAPPRRPPPHRPSPSVPATRRRPSPSTPTTSSPTRTPRPSPRRRPRARPGTRTSSRRRRSSSRRRRSTTGSGSSRSRRATSTSTADALPRERRLTWLDVFADAPLRGNPLVVVHDADDLDPGTMLAFARETGMSETTFVQAATEPGADYRNRIFDPAKELRFAGHPSLGTAVAVARARDETAASYVQQTPAGLQPIDVTLDGRRAQASMLQEPPTFGPELDPGEILSLAGLGEAHADPELPPQLVGTGVAQAIAPVREGALGDAEPDYTRIPAVLDGFEAIVLYLAVCDPDRAAARARAFGHTADMGEDPGTGSAAGPLMAYLHARTGLDHLEIDQGVEMGRPARLSCAMEGDRPRVGGAVAILVEGTVSL